MRKTLICLAFLAPFFFVACAETPTDPMVPPVAATECWGEEYGEQCDDYSSTFRLLSAEIIRVMEGGVTVKLTSEGGHIMAGSVVVQRIGDTYGSAECFPDGYGGATCSVPMSPYTCTPVEHENQTYVSFYIFAEARGTGSGNWGMYAQDTIERISGGRCPYIWLA